MQIKETSDGHLIRKKLGWRKA